MVARIILTILVSLSANASPKNCWTDILQPEQTSRVLILVTEQSELATSPELRILHDYGQVKVVNPRSFPLTLQSSYDVYAILKTGEDQYQMADIRKVSPLVVKTHAELTDFFKSTYPGLETSARLGLGASLLALSFSEKQRPFDGEAWDSDPAKQSP